VHVYFELRSLRGERRGPGGGQKSICSPTSAPVTVDRRLAAAAVYIGEQEPRALQSHITEAVVSQSLVACSSPSSMMQLPLQLFVLIAFPLLTAGKLFCVYVNHVLLSCLKQDTRVSQRGHTMLRDAKKLCCGTQDRSR